MSDPQTEAISHGIHQNRVDQLNPSLAIQEVFAGNDIFVSVHSPARFESAIAGQQPFVTFLTCADSRVNQMTFNFDVFGRVFEVRDIGNQLRPVAGSIDYGVLHLKTPLLMVMGHVQCGAVKAAMGDYERETFEIVDELDRLHLPLQQAHAGDSFDDRWLQSVEYNVDHQVGLCVRRYKSLIEAGSLAVVGAVYDFANLYKRGHGRTICVNLNGKNTVAAILADPLLESLDAKVMEVSVARYTNAV